MKRSLLFTLSFFFLFNATLLQAQTTGGNYNFQQTWQKQHDGLIRAIEDRQTVKLDAAQASVAKATGATAQRLIASSGYDYAYGMGLTDSMRYVYSGNRSSAFDYNSMNFPGTFYQWDGTSPAAALIGDLMMHQGNIPAILCDSSTLYRISATDSEWNYVQQTATVYDANNNVIDYYSPFLTNPIPNYIANRVINTYDAEQHLTSSLIFNWDNGVWDTSRNRVFAYNGNMIVMDSSNHYVNGAWSPEYKWNYVYDIAGNIVQATGYSDTTGTWLETTQYILKYDLANRVVGDSISICPYGTWMPLSRDSVGYSAGANYVTYEKEIEYGAFIGVEDMYWTRVKHITSGVVDSTYNFLYSLYDNSIMRAVNEQYEYNSNGDILTENQYYFHDTAGNNGYYSTSPDFIEHYYYQTYNTGVNNVAKQLVNITVYPNPASNEITIAQAGIQHGALTYISLYNALGQTMYSESLPWMNSTETISVANLKAGNYWIVIQDKDGNILGRQAMVKE